MFFKYLTFANREFHPPRGGAAALPPLNLFKFFTIKWVVSVATGQGREREGRILTSSPGYHLLNQ